MRVNLEIDDELMETALWESGLRALIQRGRRKKLIEAFGRYPWNGDLADLRGSRGENAG